MKGSEELMAGRLLIAAPGGSGIFERSVVLLARHSAEDGAFGLILNRPSEQKVGALVKDESLSPLAKLPVHVGGPVGTGALSFAAFWRKPDGEFGYAPQISAEDAIKRDRQSGTLVRPFIGYAGWSAGQLEDELQRHAWFLVDVPDQLLAWPHDRALWAETLRSLTPFHRVIAEFPDRPELN